jgi:nucleoside-diphosphate-sugar epimerase
MLTEAALALGLSIAWPRIFFVYGPREPEGRLLGDLIAGLRARREVPCTDGIQERDFLATPDIAAALVHLLEVSAEGPVNVASGQSIPVRDLITAAAEALGAPDLIRLGARARPVDDPTRILANTDRLASLGFRPKFDLAEGMADAIRRTP